MGATGPPGPTASGYASADGALPLPDEQDDHLKVLDLDSGPGHSGPIKVGFEARLIANSALTVQANAAGLSIAACRLVLSRTGSPDVSLGQRQDTSVSGVGFDVIALTGAADVTPGSYGVEVICFSGGGDPSISKRDLTVVAVAR